MLQHYIESSIFKLNSSRLNYIRMSPDLTESFQYFNFSYIKCIFLRFEYFLYFFDSYNFIVGDIEALVDGAKRSRAYFLQNLVLAQN